MFKQHFELKDFGWEKTYKEFVNSHVMAVFCVDCSWSIVIVMICVDQAATKTVSMNFEEYFDVDIWLIWDPGITIGYGYNLVPLGNVEVVLALLEEKQFSEGRTVMSPFLDTYFHFYFIKFN